MKVAIFFQMRPYKSQIRFVLLLAMLFLTERSLYPSFNAAAYKSEENKKLYFEEYCITKDTAFVFPIISGIKEKEVKAPSYSWLYPDYTGLHLWSKDSLKWMSLSRYLFEAMFPNYINDTSQVAVVEIVGRSLHKSGNGNAFNNGYYSMQIMGQGKLSRDQLFSFFVENNDSIRNSYLDSVITMYVTECRAEDVNHDIAFLQMCHETGFLRFGGTVDSSQNNFCGLGTINAATPGEYFPTPQEGIRAHIQHLKAYASNEALRQELVDRRFYFVERGAAPVIRQLTGKWAADPDYDHKLVGLIQRVEKHTGKPLI